MKLKKNLINTLEEMTLLALFICIFVRAFILGRYRPMNLLIVNKLHRLKGEPVEEIIDDGGVILNDDQAEAALQFELSKLDAFQRKIKEMSDQRD